MFESAAKRVLLADHTKFERRALHHFAALQEFDAVIVDEDIPISHLSRLRSKGVNVIVADGERTAEVSTIAGVLGLPDSVPPFA